MQMNNSDSPFDKLEANLRALSARVPDLPLCGILLCRLFLQLGRGMAADFEPETAQDSFSSLAEPAVQRLHDALICSQSYGGLITIICRI